MTGRRGRTAGLRAALVLLAVAPLGGCVTEGLAFQADDRVEFVTPKERERVSLPVTLRWETSLPAPSAGGPYYAVFVDREPVRPGHTLSNVVEDSCRRDPACPDLEYLAGRGVHLAGTPELTLETIPDRSTATRTGARESHEVTVVLVDGDGRRIDEAAWSRRFTVERDR
jgi:hypothetical protein